MFSVGTCYLFLLPFHGEFHELLFFLSLLAKTELSGQRACSLLKVQTHAYLPPLFQSHPWAWVSGMLLDTLASFPWQMEDWQPLCHLRRQMAGSIHSYTTC